MSADLSQEIHPITNVYHGSLNAQERGRGISRYEAAWNKDRHIGTFDDLIMRQLQLAKGASRGTVNILDIGSGDAVPYQEFLNNPLACPKARAFLQDNPSIVLNLIGLTDAPTPEQIFSKKELSSKISSQNTNISARNINYSLTARQTLSEFLTHEQIDELDLVTATWSLTYMGTRVFRQVMEDSINRLRPHGGEMIVAAYAEQEIPGFRRPDPMLPHELDVRNIEGVNNSLLKRALEDNHLRFYTRGVDIDEEEKGVDLAEDFLVKIGILDAETVNKAREEYLDDIRTSRREKGGALSIRTHQTISQSIERLARKKALELKVLKQSILDDFKKGLEDKANIDYSETVITVKKL